jgi:hypothetical protein
MFTAVNTSCVPKLCYYSAYCLIRYVLIRIRNAERFMNSSIRFGCKIMLHNEHTF